ncbi:LOW QUALITY PROTEIN: hypothetical protein PHMEG_00036657 [Phytophthora megakarya]|uniref:Uncharacterized protein n=1 Tax=Phytophthora megakarya TaxID=4795 RepID=A0A225ULB0_9STRA|nr:LOW QUALITY PROTEIN: hypothetical protein PHMEG_00036657 [Phytophthora megakarya]
MCFESLDATDLQDPNTLMGGDVADCLPTSRQRVALVSLAAEVNSIAARIGCVVGSIPAGSPGGEDDYEGSDTLSSDTLVARENFDVMRREWTAMCRHWGQRERTLKQDRLDGEDFLRQGLRDVEFHHQARIQKLTNQDANALVDFLMGNQPKINVMFDWMRLAALLHHFAESTSIPESWLTNINVV